MGVRVKMIQNACKNSIKRNLFWEESQEQHCRERGAHGGREVEHGGNEGCKGRTLGMSEFSAIGRQAQEGDVMAARHRNCTTSTRVPYVAVNVCAGTCVLESFGDQRDRHEAPEALHYIQVHHAARPPCVQIGTAARCSARASRSQVGVIERTDWD